MDAVARRLAELPIELLRHDPRVDAWRGPAYRLAELRRALASSGVRVRDEIGPPTRLRLPSPTLRPYQQAALDAWRATGKGLVVLPTGAGKTHVAMAVMAAASCAALVLVPTRALMHQWIERVRACGDKLELARSLPAGHRVLLCVDQALGGDAAKKLHALPGVVMFRGRVDVDALLVAAERLADA